MLPHKIGIIFIALSLCLFVVRFAYGADAVPPSVIPVANTAACSAGSVCVSPDDQVAIKQVLLEKHCLLTEKPTLQVDPITVVTDTQGRVYGSGADPHPYKVQLHWCNYDVTATGDVELQVAVREPPTWGWRFRVKATVGFLFTDAILAKDAAQGIDGGLLLEPFYYKFLNANAYVGVRSVGLAVGIDVFKNVSVAVGYTLSYDGWHSNPFIGIGFALW